jgi:hypothetical protein
MSGPHAVPSEAGAPRALNLPRPVHVSSGPDGVPTRVDDQQVELVRESWLVEDRWWTGRPLRRRYWEVVSVRGRNLVVFHDLTTRAWGAHSPEGWVSPEDRVAQRWVGSGSGGWFAQAA